ncbi:MAG: DUF3299 domain-containing protein [Betaproteobacteria bacterium]|nr:DUF3299 domain-containing protein [Betaproteobacteria bacterium]
MDLRRRRWLKGLAAGLVLALGTAQAQLRGNYRTLQWDDLLPPGWDPRSALGGVDLSRIPEGSAEELELQRKMRKIWDNAPVRPELDGLRVRLPGYAVPLEYSTGALREFLLVPYFGACIHTPPPPANQIVRVKLQKAARIRTMDACWVAGILSIEQGNSDWGVSGYTLVGHQVDEYRGPRKP